MQPPPAPVEPVAPAPAATSTPVNPSPSPAPPSPPPYTPPQPVIAPPPSYQPMAVEPPRRTSSLSPVWVAVFSAVGLVALLAILYMFVLPRGSRSGKTAAVELEKPGTAGAENGAAAHPLGKYIEITGLRVSEGGSGQAKIAFVAVNHSPADLPELDAHLTLTAGGAKTFEFPVQIPSIGPYEAKDISTSVRTELKPYELPDWQTLKPSLRIVSER
ncbi:MAG TPA: hypothetical protein VER03_15470 [Bryobacteraceae bacterium]|nr:hypothetical protein [Bryobacteraceae bacterium]